MIKHIRHPGIVTDDLEPLLHFYHDLLGLRVVARADESGSFIDAILGLQGVVVTTVKLKTLDGNILELLQYKSHPRSAITRDINDIGISHLAFTVDDVDNDYERLKGEGIRFYSCPQTNPEGTAKVVFCEDPGGNILELVQIL